MNWFSAAAGWRIPAHQFRRIPARELALRRGAGATGEHCGRLLAPQGSHGFGRFRTPSPRIARSASSYVPG